MTSSNATDRLPPQWAQRCASGLFSRPHRGQCMTNDSLGRVRQRAGRALAALLWAAGPVVLSHWPAAVARLPALGVLRCPLGLALLALGTAIAVGRLWRPRARLDPSTGILFAFAA